MNFSEHNMNGDMDASSATDAGDERHMTVGGGEFNEQDSSFNFDEKPKLKINGGALMIVVVAMIAAVGLFSMRTLTRASAASSPPEEIEQSIDAFLTVVLQKASERSGNNEGVLDVLNESYASRQVPLDEVQRNPFIIFEQVAGSAPAVTDPIDPLAGRRRARLTEFERAAGELRVGMILMGSQPLANVNNRIVKVGDHVEIKPEVGFRVANITSDRVEFIAEDFDLGVQYERVVNLRRD